MDSETRFSHQTPSIDRVYRSDGRCADMLINHERVGQSVDALLSHLRSFGNPRN